MTSLCNYRYVLMIPRAAPSFESVSTPLVHHSESDEHSSCDELMEFKQIQTRAQPEESLKHNRSCTMMSLLVQVT